MQLHHLLPPSKQQENVSSLSMLSYMEPNMDQTNPWCIIGLSRDSIASTRRNSSFSSNISHWWPCLRIAQPPSFRTRGHKVDCPHSPTHCHRSPRIPQAPSQVPGVLCGHNEWQLDNEVLSAWCNTGTVCGHSSMPGGHCRQTILGTPWLNGPLSQQQITLLQSHLCRFVYLVCDPGPFLGSHYQHGDMIPVYLYHGIWHTSGLWTGSCHIMVLSLRVRTVMLWKESLAAPQLIRMSQYHPQGSVIL